MNTIHAFQIKPLDGLPSGTVRPFEEADFTRLNDLGAVRAATDDEVKAAPGYQNKMAPAAHNKDIGGQRDENGDTVEMAELRSKFTFAIMDQSAKLSTANAEVERLSDELVSMTRAANVHGQEIAQLNELLAGKEAEIATLRVKPIAAPLKAEHHGGGKFNITQGETTVASGLTKTDADAFNAMSDEDKAAFVAKPKA